MPTTILGLGKMGLAIAENLVNANHEVYAYNRSARIDLDNRIKFFSNPQPAIRNATTIVISLSDETAIQNVILKNNEINCSFISNSVVIDTTTHRPEFAEFLHEKFAKIDVAYLDAPVSGGPEGARNGTLSVMVGGEKKDFDRCKSLLNILGKNIFYLGGPGTGQACKLANQIMVGISQIATCETVLFGRHFDLDLHQLLEVIRCSTGASYIFNRSAPQMIEGRFKKGFQTYLINKDLNNASNSANGKDLKLPLTDLASKILETHTKSQYREVDAASIIKQYEKILEQIKV